MLVVNIVEAKYLGGYSIQLVFSDGLTRALDFQPFLERAKNPMTRKFLDLENFKNFRLENGDLLWNDFELCFPVWDLHEGKI